MRTTGLVEHRAHTVVDSPVGPLTLVAVDGTLAGLYLDGQRHRPPAVPPTVPPDRPGPAARPLGEADASLLAEAAAQLADYFAGRRTAFDVPLTLAGTPFQRAVWEALLTIPHGETATYGELAGRVGRPGAARAVGLANGRNPISIVVPCHRVVGAAGALTGYGGGLDRKRWLLAHEQGHRQGSLPA